MMDKKSIISKWNADLYEQEVTYTHDVDCLLSLIGDKPKRILEVCCGSGRILVPLAKAGHTVDGFDADEYMLAKIADKAVGMDNINWKMMDAVHGDWDCNYDIVVLGGNILYNIVSDMDYSRAQEMLIKKTAAALAPGGHVFIDYQPGGHLITQSEPSHNRDGEWTIWNGTDADGNRGRMMILGDSYDAATGMGGFVRRYELTLKNGETITQNTVCQKHFAPLKQLHRWLRDAGFVIEREYGDFNGAPVAEDSRGVVIYARKV